MVAFSASQSRAADSTSVLSTVSKSNVRAADDLQHVSGRGLLPEGFAQVLSACLHLVEQPHILDRNNRLVGKG